MTTSGSKIELPLDVWQNNIRCSSVAARIQLGRASHALHRLTQAVLYHTLIIDGRKPRNYTVGARTDGRSTIHEPTHVDGTYVRDLELFIRTHTNQGSWLSLVKVAYLLWTEDAPGYAASPSSRQPSVTYEFMHSHSEAPVQFLSTIEDLLCDASHKIELHMVLPLDVLPSPSIRSSAHIKTLSIGCRTRLQTDFLALRDVVEIPTLHTLEIMKMETIESRDVSIALQAIPSLGCSSVTELHLPVCEPPTLALSDFFRWPKHLKTLEIWICVTQQQNEFSVQKVLSTISGLSSTLEDLELLFGHPYHYSRFDSIPTSAFKHFTKLRRLVTSADVVASKTHSMSAKDDHTFYTNFPPCLKDLTLVFEADRLYNRALRDNMHMIIYGKPDTLGNIISGLNCGCAGSEYRRASEPDCANDLFKELAQLAEHKAELPNLCKLHLSTNFIQWIACERVRQHMNTLKESGIAVSTGFRKHLLSSFGRETRWELLSTP